MACMNLQVQNCPLGCDTKINDLNKLNDNLDRLYNDCYIKVQAYQNAVKTLESQRAWYQNNQLAYEEKIRVLQRDLENTSNELKYSEKINAEIKMEKQDLQAKLDNSLSRFNKWKESSKNLAKLIDNSLSVKSKLGLGYKDYTGPNEIYYPEIQSIFDPEKADDKTLYHQEHVRFVKEGGMNAVPPPITGIFMPSSNQPDIDESKMTYGKKSCESIPAEESLPKPAVIEPKTSENVVCKSKLSAESPEFIPQSVCSKNKNVKKTDKLRKNNKTPRGNQRGWNGMMNQKLGDNFEFKNKACYVCGSFDHLQHTCKHKKKMNKQEQVKPIWNKSRHVNHQNFVQKPFHKKTSNYNRCINKNVKGTRYDSSKTKTKVNPVKALAKWVWKPKQAVLEHVSKSSRASKVLTRYDYVDVYGRFKSVLAWDFQKH
ncbi:hypothetical protein Tco_0445290 [Tanacetum coccineum]